MLLSLTALAVALTGAMAAGPVLTLNPSNGVVSGTPGSTVGWGFTLSNDSGFLVPSLGVFCEGAFNSGCAPTFRNIHGLRRAVSTERGGSHGHGSVQQRDAARELERKDSCECSDRITDAGSDLSGLRHILKAGDITDANCDPTQTGFSQLLSAPASVNVVGAVPEPGSAGLIFVGVALLMARLRKAR